MARTTLFQAAFRELAEPPRWAEPFQRARPLVVFELRGSSACVQPHPLPSFKRRIRSTASQRAVYPRKTDECLPSSGPNFPVDSLAAATTKCAEIRLIRSEKRAFNSKYLHFSLLLVEVNLRDGRILFFFFRKFKAAQGIVALTGVVVAEPVRSSWKFCESMLCKFKLVEKLVFGRWLIRIVVGLLSLFLSIDIRLIYEWWLFNCWWLLDTCFFIFKTGATNFRTNFFRWSTPWSKFRACHVALINHEIGWAPWTNFKLLLHTIRLILPWVMTQCYVFQFVKVEICW